MQYNTIIETSNKRACHEDMKHRAASLQQLSFL